MKKTAKTVITATAAIAVAIPALMLLNDNADAWYLNLIGVAYIYAAVKVVQKIVPGWMVRYIEDIREPEDGNHI